MRQLAIFDAYNTLFDVGGLSELAERELAGRGAALVALWRTKQLEYTWLLSLLGRYEDFWAVTEAALDYACEALGVDLPGAARKRLLQGLLYVPAFPDAGPALAALTARGVRCCIFSNGTRTMLEAAVQANGFGPYLEQVLSVDDEVRMYKPHPAGYGYVCRRLGIRPAEAYFVSSNGFDVAGAGAFGFPTVWVNRKLAPSERLGIALDVVVGDLAEFARML